MKALEDDIRKNLENLEYDHDFLDTIQQAQSMKEVMYKLDFIKTENIYSDKENI